MKSIIHIVKTNIQHHKSANLSLFLILLIMSAASTIGLSVMFGIKSDFHSSIDHMNSLHGAAIMNKDIYLPEFEDFYKNDPRVTQYEIGEILFPSKPVIEYGGKMEMLRLLIFNLDTQWKISPPVIIKQDLTIVSDNAVYLPHYAQNFGYDTGSKFEMIYRNKTYEFIVAGFFESNEYNLPNGIGIKIFVSNDCYKELTKSIGESVWIASRFKNPYDSVSFNADFLTQMDIDLGLVSSNGAILDFNSSSIVLNIIEVPAAVILLFAFLIFLTALIVIRFRVTTTIDRSMPVIGVLKASGYTNRQMISIYLLEYLVLSFSASLIGILLSIPAFTFVRFILFTMSGIVWNLSVNILIGLIQAVITVLILLTMILFSSLRIAHISPVQAFRGEISTDNISYNFLPLERRYGNIQILLGMKNMFANIKLYILICFIVATFSLSITFIAGLYCNMVLDPSSSFKMNGAELTDVALSVTKHTNADELLKKLETMPEIRKTSMQDTISAVIEMRSALLTISDNYDLYETFLPVKGRFPKHDNEIALSNVYAALENKKIGDTIMVKANGITLEFIVTGFFSTLDSYSACLTLEGYQMFDPNYKRRTINVYLKDGVTYDDFYEVIKQNFGVLNVYEENEDTRYAKAKARAEEKISNYLAHYNISSIEYAVIYQGEIILSGSSDSYQIEQITNFKERLETQMITFAQAITTLTQAIATFSLILIALILSMTIKNIIIKRRGDFGILKSCGYTSQQLAIQLASSFLPASCIGALIGMTAGSLLINPVMNLLIQSMGATNVDLAANVSVLTIIFIILILVIFIFSYIFAMRIRKISVYELLTE